MTFKDSRARGKAYKEIDTIRYARGEVAKSRGKSWNVDKSRVSGLRVVVKVMGSRGQVMGEGSYLHQYRRI